MYVVFQNSRVPSISKIAANLTLVFRAWSTVLGCCNDARIIYKILESKGFEPSDIKLIIDDDDSVPDPNGAEVKKALNWLCTDRSPDDVIFFHFSGHGTQIPSDGDDEEEDAKDEAIVLEQMFLMAVRVSSNVIPCHFQSAVPPKLVVTLTIFLFVLAFYSAGWRSEVFLQQASTRM